MYWIFGLVFLVLLAVLVIMVLKLVSGVNQRLNQMNQSILEANRIIGANLGQATGVFGSVEEKLGRLQQTNQQICEISKDISSLQELLRVPKLRGQIGEALLESLLSQVLPANYFQMQYRFRTGDSVDAVVRLGGKIVPVDAKFSLDNFQKIQSADESQKNSYIKKFIQDVKNRIDEIAAKYILPEENTYDFALMYIPAENVYYEIIIKQDLFNYCVAKKVIPVSPNTFYAYLQVICLGLRGLKVEENARQILKSLGGLSNEVNKFREEFALLGGHLTNAGRKYDDSRRRMEKFSDKLSNIHDNQAIESKSKK